MKIPDSPCASCGRGKRCTAKSDACKKFWDWFKPAWREIQECFAFKSGER